MLLFPFFLSATLSLLVIIIFVTRKDHDPINRWLIGTILFTVLFQIFIFFIMTTGRLSNYWYLFRLGCPVYYLTPPLIFLYIAYNFKRDRKVFRHLPLHAIPFLISLLDIGWYYLNTTSADRISEIATIKNDPSTEFLLGAGFLPSVAHYYFRFVQRIFYIGMQWYLIARKTEGKASNSFYKWSFFLTAAQTVILIGYGYFATQIFFFSEPGMLNGFEFAKKISLMVVFLGITAICIYLFMYPEILYGTIISNPKVKKAKKQKTAEAEKTAVQSMETEDYQWLPKGTDIHQLCAKLENFMQTEKPFLQKRTSVSDIAQKLEIPTHLLSAVLNKHYGKSFSDFINEYRIRLIVDYIKENPNWDQFTIEGIVSDAGFSSRTAFYTAFKKLTGTSPRLYLSEQHDIATEKPLGPVLNCDDEVDKVKIS